jgi:acyl-CoA synthetase (AMP-forming)/AMP-acid ligase II
MQWQAPTGQAPTGSGGICAYSAVSYSGTLVAAVLQVGSAFLTLGLQPQDRVGVFGNNCPEWMLAMQGCNRTRCVPYYVSEQYMRQVFVIQILCHLLQVDSLPGAPWHALVPLWLKAVR